SAIRKLSAPPKDRPHRTDPLSTAQSRAPRGFSPQGGYLVFSQTETRVQLYLESQSVFFALPDPSNKHPHVTFACGLLFNAFRSLAPGALRSLPDSSCISRGAHESGEQGGGGAPAAARAFGRASKAEGDKGRFSLSDTFHAACLSGVRLFEVW
ncbi:unnamed protein product, partial [Laminaria digitata]